MQTSSESLQLVLVIGWKIPIYSRGINEVHNACPQECGDTKMIVPTMSTIWSSLSVCCTHVSFDSPGQSFWKLCRNRSQRSHAGISKSIKSNLWWFPLLLESEYHHLKSTFCYGFFGYPTSSSSFIDSFILTETLLLVSKEGFSSFEGADAAHCMPYTSQIKYSHNNEWAAWLSPFSIYRAMLLYHFNGKIFDQMVNCADIMVFHQARSVDLHHVDKIT